MVKNLFCGQCKNKILGKIHQDGKLIIQHKGLRILVEYNSSLSIMCPLCGGETLYNQRKLHIEDIENA